MAIRQGWKDALMDCVDSLMDALMDCVDSLMYAMYLRICARVAKKTFLLQHSSATASIELCRGSVVGWLLQLFSLPLATSVIPVVKPTSRLS